MKQRVSLKSAWAVNPNMKLATFPRMILVNKPFRMACSPGSLWYFLQNTVGIYNIVNDDLLENAAK